MFADEEGEPLIPVHICWDDGEAAIVESLLKSHGIKTLLNSELPHTVMPLLADGLGAVQVLVEGASVQRAKELLAQHGEIEAED